jgi:hypothetical protein
LRGWLLLLVLLPWWGHVMVLAVPTLLNGPCLDDLLLLGHACCGVACCVACSTPILPHPCSSARYHIPRSSRSWPAVKRNMCCLVLLLRLFNRCCCTWRMHLLGHTSRCLLLLWRHRLLLLVGLLRWRGFGTTLTNTLAAAALSRRVWCELCWRTSGTACPRCGRLWLRHHRASYAATLPLLGPVAIRRRWLLLLLPLLLL